MESKFVLKNKTFGMIQGPCTMIKKIYLAALKTIQ